VSLRIDWTPGAQRDLNRLDRPNSARMVAAVLRLAETSQGDVVKLAGKQPPEYRLRVGGWRIRFAWEQAAGVLIVLHIFKRGQGYD
jgi:mRNA-degrading endonuclease RelE of RelBE toxin-antitoxin system